MSHRLTFEATRSALESGATSVERVTGEFLDVVAAGKRLNAFLSVFQDQAMEQARAVDRKLAAGKGGALAGMVVAVKDVLCMTGQRTTCGSKMLENFVSVYDATAVSRLRAADAVLIGKTNMDEFAMGSSTRRIRRSARCETPWTKRRSPAGRAAGPAWRLPQVWPTPPSGPTPAAPSASLRPSAASWD